MHGGDAEEGRAREGIRRGAQVGCAGLGLDVGRTGGGIGYPLAMSETRNVERCSGIMASGGVSAFFR
jgi:hypothetical protein